MNTKTIADAHIIKSIEELIRSAHFNEALQLLNPYLEKTNITDESKVLLLKRKGQIYFELGQFVKALDFFTQALLIAEQAGPKKEIAILYSNIGAIHDSFGNFSLAIEQYQKALAIQKELQDPHQLGRTLNNMGLACKNLGQYTEARTYYTQAQTANLATQNDDNIPCTLNNLANLGILQDDLHDVSKYIHEALRIAEKNNDTLEKAFSTLNQGQLALKQGNKIVASGYVNTALALNTEAACAEGIIEALITLAEINAEYDSALSIEFLLDASEKAKESSLPLLLSRCYEKLHPLYAKIGNIDEAYHISLLSMEITKQITKNCAETASRFQKMIWQVDELHRAKEKAEIEANIDLLTGLHRRSKSSELLITQNYNLALRNKRPCTFAMLDLDHFKLVNDTYGHSMGDTVLTTVSKIIRDTLRDVDLTIRYGGEEIFIVLPDTNTVDAFTALEKVRLAIKDYVWESIQPGLQVTASFGISDKVSSNYSWETVQNQADKALYQAKATGRNRIEVFDNAG